MSGVLNFGRAIVKVCERDHTWFCEKSKLSVASTVTPSLEAFHRQRCQG